MTLPRILVTPRSVTAHGHPSLDRLSAAGYEVVLSSPGRLPTEAELCELLPGCIGYLAGVEPVTDAVLAAARDLRVISRNGTGVDNIDLGAAAARGIVVRRADGANARGVAELALGLILALARHLPRTDAALKRGEWIRHQGIELAGRTLGLLGCGRIGQQLARIAGSLGMRVLAHDPLADGRFAPGDFFSFASFGEVLVRAHVLSLHCPPPTDGRPPIDAAALATVRSGLLLVNTARFDLLDADAILEALDDRRLGGLALDVFAEEPPVDRRLVQHPKVIATAHIGGYTTESVDRAMDVAVDQLLQGLDPSADTKPRL